MQREDANITKFVLFHVNGFVAGRLRTPHTDAKVNLVCPDENVLSVNVRLFIQYNHQTSKVGRFCSVLFAAEFLNLF